MADDTINGAIRPQDAANSRRRSSRSSCLDESEYTFSDEPAATNNVVQSVASKNRARADEDLLTRVVADSCTNAFGCVFVEAWVLSNDGTKLTRPSGGHWMSPSFSQSLPTEELIQNAMQLDMEARDCAPGAGLAGTLFNDCTTNGHVHWRQIKVLMDDPFVQREYGNRMKKLYSLGIGLVASVGFSSLDERGIVLYYSRSTASMERLRADSNEHFLVGATNLIGASFAIRKPREECAELRKEMFRTAIRKVRMELKKKKKMSLGSIVLDKDEMAKLVAELNREDAQNHDEEKSWASQTLHTTMQIVKRPGKFVYKVGKKTYKLGKKVAMRLNSSRKKWGGAKMHGPPRQSVQDCVFVFVGVFLCMLTMLKISTSLSTDSRFLIDGGWYSGTLCIICEYYLSQPFETFGYTSL